MTAQRTSLPLNILSRGRIIHYKFGGCSLQKRWRTLVISLKDNKTIATFDFGSWVYIDWTADSQSIIYSLNNAKMGTNSLMVQTLSGGAPKEFLTLENDEVYQAAWSRDGKQLAIARGKLRRFRFADAETLRAGTDFS